MKLTKKNIIHSFSKIIENYLHDSNLFIKKNTNIINIDFIVIKGVNLIIHVFKLLIIQSGDLKLTSQRTNYAFTVYLEFIEQINNIPIITDLNIIDAIKFVINEIIDTSTNHIFIKFEIQEILDKLLNTCNNLFDWDNNLISIETRYKLVKQGNLIKLLD